MIRFKTFLLTAILCISALSAKEMPYHYSFFENSLTPNDYYYTQVSYDGESWVKNARKHLPITTDAYTPGNALNLTYITAGDGSKWEVVLQFAQIRGQEIRRAAEELSINIKQGATPREAMPKVQFIFSDSTRSKVMDMMAFAKPAAKKGWQHVCIPISAFDITDFNMEASDVGVYRELPKKRSVIAIVFTSTLADGKQHTITIDDVEILPATKPQATVETPTMLGAKGYERHIDINWTPRTAGKEIKYYMVYRSEDGINYEAINTVDPRINRYADFVGEIGKTYYYKVSEVNYSLQESALSNDVKATTRAMTDDELLSMVQEACFRYYWDGAEEHSGLARENIPGRTHMIATGASGFGIMATVVGASRGFITRDQAIERFLKITSFLTDVDHFHGAFSHFMNGEKRNAEAFFGAWDNGGDLVETSFITQGLLVARQYFNGSDAREKEIRDRIDNLWKNIEWSWYKKDKDGKDLLWHWSPTVAWKVNHHLIGWNETMITYLLAIFAPKYSVPASFYYTGWASQDENAQAYRKGWGMVDDGKMYTNGNTYFGIKLPVAVSNGGPLFFTHYSFMGFNPHKLTDRYTNYFENNRAIALINHRYCMENPGNYTGYGYDCWGLTASDYAWGYWAREPMPNHDNGTIAPTGALASMPYAPAEAIAALKNYYRNYGHLIWGAYGFRDAFNLTDNWVSPIFMGLNQGPITVMIENYRTGLVWDLFMSHPDVKAGLQKLDAIK